MSTESHLYVGRENQPMTAEERVGAFTDPAGRLLRQDVFAGIRLKTVWAAINVPEIDVLPFGTGRITDGKIEEVEQYPTRELAVKRHEEHYWAIRSGHHCAVCAEGGKHDE